MLEVNQTLPTADLNTGTTDVIPSVAIDRIIAQRNREYCTVHAGDGMHRRLAHTKGAARCVR